MIRILIPLIAASVLVACTSGDWPTGKDMDAYEHPIVQERYDAATKKMLGTTQDLEGIKALIRNEGGRLDSVRWQSKEEVILYVTINPDAPLGLETYFYVLKKEDGHWRIVARYMYEIA